MLWTASNNSLTSFWLDSLTWMLILIASFAPFPIVINPVNRSLHRFVLSQARLSLKAAWSNFSQYRSLHLLKFYLLYSFTKCLQNAILIVVIFIGFFTDRLEYLICAVRNWIFRILNVLENNASVLIVWGFYISLESLGLI